MDSSSWSWANLNGDQVQMLQEAEQTLGADLLLAYQQDAAASIRTDQFMQSGLETARLNDSQIECLQGLEDKMQAVVIAYQQHRS